MLALKTVTERYQHGSIRRVRRAKGFAWEFRFYADVS
jgi:integrase